MLTTTPRRPPAPTRGSWSRGTLVAELRRRGARGGVIAKHRAMVGIPVTPRLLADVVALPIALTVAVLFALPWIADRWGALFRLVAGPLGFGAPALTRVVDVADVYALAIPYVAGEAGWPSARTLWIAGVVTLLAAVAPAALPPRFTPLRILVRAVAAIQAAAVAYFALAAPPFPYALADYFIGFMSTGAAVLALLPLLLGATYFVFGVPLWHKLALTALVVGHLAVLFPLQALVHAWLITRLGALALPLLFLVFGLLVETLVFVAFYGWAMSWGPRGRRLP